MRTPSSAFFLLIAWLAVGHCLGDEVLPPFGQLPDSGKNWKLCEKGKYGKSSFQWHWVIQTNAENGDVLSYAAHRFEPGEMRELKLINLSDTAGEIFPFGYFAWTSGPKPHTIHPIRSRVTKLNLMDSAAKKDLSQEALEYSHVQEEERGTNRLAHGYALVFDDVAVYVQHTSTKPITPEFAYDRAVSLLSSHFQDKAAAKSEQPSTPNPTK